MTMTLTNNWRADLDRVPPSIFAGSKLPAAKRYEELRQRANLIAGQIREAESAVADARRSHAVADAQLTTARATYEVALAAGDKPDSAPVEALQSERDKLAERVQHLAVEASAAKQEARRSLRAETLRELTELVDNNMVDLIVEFEQNMRAALVAKVRESAAMLVHDLRQLDASDRALGTLVDLCTATDHRDVTHTPSVRLDAIAALTTLLEAESITAEFFLRWRDWNAYDNPPAVFAALRRALDAGVLRGQTGTRGVKHWPGDDEAPPMRLRARRA